MLENPAKDLKKTLQEYISIKKMQNIKKTHYCNQCSYSSKRSFNLKCHMLVHNGEKPFVCLQCDLSFKRAKHLKSLAKNHTNAEIVITNVLIEAIWGGISWFIAKKSPSNATCVSMHAVEKSELNKHIRIHSLEKPFKCEQCHFAGTRKSDLSLHMRTHSGDKSYKCNQCEYASRQSSHLKTHMMTHGGEKFHNCDQCEYSSRYAGNLKTHIAGKHLGQRTHKCDSAVWTLF